MKIETSPSVIEEIPGRDSPMNRRTRGSSGLSVVNFFLVVSTAHHTPGEIDEERKLKNLNIKMLMITPVVLSISSLSSGVTMSGALLLPLRRQSLSFGDNDSADTHGSTIPTRRCGGYITVN